AWRDLSGGW
uniref:Neuropeptide Grb-AST B3 n=1 Tax=Gryllus bimaculatus TaxID=6999 RepID=Q7M3N7_GRYBI|nr:juvenile hormone inhibitory neuropeptide grb-AST:SUBUNIT=B3 [Gryllus bimaculatus]